MAEWHRDRLPTELQVAGLGVPLTGPHRDWNQKNATMRPWCWSFSSLLSKHSVGPGWTLGRPNGKCGRDWPSGSWDIIKIKINGKKKIRTTSLSSELSSDPVERFSELLSGWHSDYFDKSSKERGKLLWGRKITLSLSLSLSLTHTHTHTHTPRAISQSHWIVFNKGKLAECQLHEVVKDRVVWRAVVHGVIKSRTRPSNWTTTAPKGKLAECQNLLPPPTGSCFLFSENSE